MLLRRGSLVVLCFLLFGVLNAHSNPVIIHLANGRDLNSLEASGFQLHSRSGDFLIGTFPAEMQFLPALDVIDLSSEVEDFSDVYQVDRRAFHDKRDLLDLLEVIYQAETLVLFKADSGQLNMLSSAGISFRVIPKDGYTYYKSDACRQGLDTMEPFVGVILDQASSATYEGYIQTLQDFVTRNTYNPECNDAAQWILQQFESMGLTAWLDSFEIGGMTRYNVIAEQTGTLHPDQMYYITGHYDATAGLPIFPEDEAPGADDNGSGAAMVLECARVMSQFDFHNTIRYAAFAGNEQGLIGSEAYVAGLPATGEIYLGVFNADMIGWSGSDPWPSDLVIYANDDPVSLILAEKISEAVTTFMPGFLEPVIIQDPLMVYGDHAPFWDVNVPGVMGMEDEAWGTDLNPYYHSDEDLLEHLDLAYAMHVLEAFLAAVADLAIPEGSIDPFLTADGVTIDDSQGNNNGRIEYGESVSLTIPIINAGGGNAISVNVMLAESDPYMTLTDFLENYGDILSLDTVAVVNAFSADITIDVPDEHQFDISVIMTSGSNSWNSIVQVIAHAPQIIIEDIIVDDSGGGNGNGRLEPGETADFEITLYNEGSWEAADLITGLTCPSPYIVIDTPPQSYGTLSPSSAVMREYVVSAITAAPAFFMADFGLSYQAAGGWTAADGFTLEIGDLTHMPSGPDTYGYLAYDVNDLPLAPGYNWIEIDPQQGGSGTLLDFTSDDETLHLTLPFEFIYYGQAYSEISVCSNGWISFGYTENTDYSNSGIPNEDGPPNMMAPFWDDLSPQHEGTVSYYYDFTNGIYIIEYNGVRDYYPSWNNMTFEVVLYDPVVHPTATGDGNILFQYGDLDNTSSCTVGIENTDQDDGIQYLFNQSYDEHATPIQDGMAILFTTGATTPEMMIELTYVSGSPVPAGGGNLTFDVLAQNGGSVPLDYDAWLEIAYEGGVPTTVVQRSFTNYQPGWAINRPGMWFPVPGSYAAGDYTFTGKVGINPNIAWDESGFPFTKSGTYDGSDFIPFIPDCEFPNPFDRIAGVEDRTLASLPGEYRFYQNYPNPFNPTTVLSFELRVSSCVLLNVFDIQGRQVAELVNGWRDAGQHSVTFDASHLASGIYFYRIEAGDFKAVRKMVLVK